MRKILVMSYESFMISGLLTRRKNQWHTSILCPTRRVSALPQKPSILSVLPPSGCPVLYYAPPGAYAGSECQIPRDFDVLSAPGQESWIFVFPLTGFLRSSAKVDSMIPY